MKKDQEITTTTTKMVAVEMVVIVRKRVAADMIGTKIGNGVAAESIVENTKSQADIAVEVGEGLAQNHIHIIHHLMTIQDLDPDRLPTKRNVRSRNINTDVTEKTTVEVVIGAEVIVKILMDKEGAQHRLLLHSAM